ncbi:hypothetical protein DFP72DRAFT_257709 [Ephemerocybe angulata]|uniref:Uncharacterized protein n=1 Tax=Ephemerocybe angulata TaxID=980116 RepID=A0A8H6H967_9AGAR|nr:hypothetical protein DFP72DRAFT_257709 [Tulosesus angulatus]
MRRDGPCCFPLSSALLVPPPHSPALTQCRLTQFPFDSPGRDGVLTRSESSLTLPPSTTARPDLELSPHKQRSRLSQWLLLPSKVFASPSFTSAPFLTPGECTLLCLLIYHDDAFTTTARPIAQTVHPSPPSLHVPQLFRSHNAVIPPLHSPRGLAHSRQCPTLLNDLLSNTAARPLHSLDTIQQRVYLRSYGRNGRIGLDARDMDQRWHGEWGKGIAGRGGYTGADIDFRTARMLGVCPAYLERTSARVLTG